MKFLIEEDCTLESYEVQYITLSVSCDTVPLMMLSFMNDEDKRETFFFPFKNCEIVLDEDSFANTECERYIEFTDYETYTDFKNKFEYVYGEKFKTHISAL